MSYKRLFFLSLLIGYLYSGRLAAKSFDSNFPLAVYKNCPDFKGNYVSLGTTPTTDGKGIVVPDDNWCVAPTICMSDDKFSDLLNEIREHSIPGLFFQLSDCGGQVIDFNDTPLGAPLLFSYSEKADDFGTVMEYELPGSGHSVDAMVETRLVRSNEQSAPNFIQQFKLDSGKTEWWAFYREGLKCNYKLTEGNLPSDLKKFWETGKRL